MGVIATDDPARVEPHLQFARLLDHEQLQLAWSPPSPTLPVQFHLLSRSDHEQLHSGFEMTNVAVEFVTPGACRSILDVGGAISALATVVAGSEGSRGRISARRKNP